MKLESLKSFEILNETEMIVIAGGLAAESSHKKDVDSDSKDCSKGDTIN